MCGGGVQWPRMQDVHVSRAKCHSVYAVHSDMLLVDLLMLCMLYFVRCMCSSTRWVCPRVSSNVEDGASQSVQVCLCVLEWLHNEWVLELVHNNWTVPFVTVAVSMYAQHI